MKTRLNVTFAAAGIAAVLLAGCVSSKKYKSSQAALQQVRNDSARLAQQVSSLNGNVQDLQQKNTTLQRSLDSSTSNYATQQKSLNYYQNYFSQQQSTMSQVSEDLKGAMSQAGLANEDVTQENNIIYVRLDENKIFKKNSPAVTTSGKQALSSIAQVIKSRSNVNVFVNDGDSSTGQGNEAMSSSSGNGNTTAMDNNANYNTSAGAAPAHHRAHHRKTSSSASGSASSSSAASSSSGNVATTSDNSKSSTTTTHKRVHHKASGSGSEGSMTYYSNRPRAHMSNAWALKQRRMSTVANDFLQNGVAKVNISLKQPSSNSNPSSDIKVVIVPMMNDFNPQSGSNAQGR